MASKDEGEELSLLAQACTDAQGILRAVTNREPSDDSGPLNPTTSLLRPHYISQCDSILFYRARKTGCLISRTHGIGFLLRRLPSNDPSSPGWSAPCFVRMETTGLGLGFGRVHTASVTACMTSKLRVEMERRRHRLFSGLESGVYCGSSIVLTSDLISAPAASYATITTSSLAGASFDFSFATGLLTVDDARNAEAYGGPVATATLLEGKVAPPPELQPLYADLEAAVIGTASDAALPSPAPPLQTGRREIEAEERRGSVLQDGTAAFYSMRY